MLMTAIRRRHDYVVAQVDVYSGPAFLWAEAVCYTLKLLRKRYVLTLHGGNLPEFAARWPSRVRQLLISAKAVTAPSGYLKDRLDPYRGGDIRVLPNPIDIEAYPFRERGPAHPNLIWLRAFNDIYNPRLAIKVLDALSTRYPKARLTMIGPDKGDGSFQQTKAEAARAGLTDKISFAGQVSKKDVPQTLASADIFLNTTNIDNTPVSVIEAMACGLCVVSTRVGGTPFLISHEQDGLLVRCGDPRAMASAVRRFVEDPAFARTCSQNARRKVENWSWTNILAEWERLLCQVAATEQPDLTAKYAKYANQNGPVVP
jgi:glycosyltransferase involved in cell wall biosynthesis